MLLYRLLGGVLPYTAENEGEIALKHAEEPVPSLRIVRPDIPEALDRVVQVALAKMPDARFPSVSALSQALNEATMMEENRIVPDSPQRLVVVRSRRTAFSWTRVAPLVTTTLLLFALVGASLFVFTLPQLRGQPFWNSLQMALTGHGFNRGHTVSSPSGPSVKPTATGNHNWRFSTTFSANSDTHSHGGTFSYSYAHCHCWYHSHCYSNWDSRYVDLHRGDAYYGRLSIYGAVLATGQ